LAPVTAAEKQAPSGLVVAGLNDTEAANKDAFADLYAAVRVCPKEGDKR